MTDDSPISRGSSAFEPNRDQAGAADASVHVRVRLGELELGYRGVRSYYETRVDDWTHQVLQRIQAGMLTPASTASTGADAADSPPEAPRPSPSAQGAAPAGAMTGEAATAPPPTASPQLAAAEGAGAASEAGGDRPAPAAPGEAAQTGILTFDDEDDEFVPIEDDASDRATFDPTGSPRFAPFLRQVGDRARRPDQQVMAFAFFLWNHERMPAFATPDLEACFKGIGIPAPADLDGIVDDLVDRQRFLAPDEQSGGLQLTPKGVNYAKNRLVRPA